MKHLAVLLGLLLLPLQAGAFPDVPATHASRRSIEYLQQNGILKGYQDGMFRPAFAINRAEFLKVLVTARGIEPPADLYSRCFPDVTTEWFAPYVCLAALQGWVQGYPDGTFKPEQPVAFAEALKMLVNVRGYPLAPAEESERRGIHPASWFAPYLTTALLLDIVSYEQVWGENATPLHAPLTRGAVAELLYRALLAEGAMTMPLTIAGCTSLPTHLEITTHVDVLLPAKTRIFRQDLRATDAAGSAGCLLAADANPFGRVAPAYDGIFLQPYPAGQPKDTWTVRVPLLNGRAILRGGDVEGTLRPEMFAADVYGGVFVQLPSLFAARGATLVTPDGRYVAYIGAAGRTVEAIDFVSGTHVLIDAVQPPQTFVALSEQTQNIALLDDAVAITYVLYDSSVPAHNGYAVLDTRTANLDVVFAPENPFDTPPVESPFEEFGQPTPVMP